MDISILIVNYNTEKFIVDLLQSLRSQTLSASHFEIIIVNNIQNNTLSQLISEHDFFSHFTLKIYESDQNVGFGRAMNLAFQQSCGKHILLMNPDIKMLQDDYLEKLLHYANENHNYGAISTKVLDDHKNDTSTYHHYEFGQNLGFDHQICWFQGSLLLIRQEVYRQLNGFDPDFFMYCEDVDLCLRIKQQGLPLLKNEQLEVYHFGGASEPSQNYDYYHRYFKSQFLFAKKHYSEQLFTQLILQLYQKSKIRVFFYHFLKKFTNKYQRHYVKNKALFDICDKIKMQGTDWLIFSQKSYH